MSAAAMPYVMGAGGLASGWLQGGEGDEIEGMPLKNTDAYSPLTYEKLMRGIESAIPVGVQRSARPVSLPSSTVGALPFFKSDSMPIDVFALGLDQALTRPELTYRPGVDWGPTPPLSSDSVAGSSVYRDAMQPSPPPPQLGGGMEEMENALGLLGVERDASGMLTFAANQFTPGPGLYSLGNLQHKLKQARNPKEPVLGGGPGGYPVGQDPSKTPTGDDQA